MFFGTFATLRRVKLSITHQMFGTPLLIECHMHITFSNSSLMYHKHLRWSFFIYNGENVFVILAPTPPKSFLFMRNSSALVSPHLIK